MGTKPNDIPFDLLRAISLQRGMTPDDAAVVIDWLREHPTEAARLLGTRTPTSWDV